MAVTRTDLQWGQAEARGTKPIRKIFRCKFINFIVLKKYF